MAQKCTTQERDVRPSGMAALRAKDRRRLIVLAVVALALVFAFALLGQLIPGMAFAVRSPAWCEARECLRHVELLTHGLNRSIDPCQDFENYVCSTWKPDARFPDLSTTALDDLAIAWLEDLPKMLQDGSKEWPVARKPLALLEACVRNTGASQFDRREFRKFMRARNLSWPEKPLGGSAALDVLLDLATRWDLTLWLRVQVIKHPFLAGAHRILIMPGRTSDIRLFAENHRRVMEAGDYPRYWKLLFSFLVDDAPGPDVDGLIKRSAEIQSMAVVALMQLALDTHGVPDLFQLAHVRDNLSNLSFVGLLEQVSRLAPHSLQNDLLMADTNVLKVLVPYLQDVSGTDVLWQLSWEFVQMYAVMLDRTLLENIMGNEQLAASHLALLCAREVDAVYRPLTVAVFARARLTPMGKNRADLLLQTLAEAASHRVNRITWMGDDAKQFLTRKLNSAIVRLWPSDLFDQYPKVEQLYAECPENDTAFATMWVKSRKCLSAVFAGGHRDDATTLLPSFAPKLTAYDPLANAVEVAVAALLSPVFSERGTAGMTFGGIAFLFLSALMSVLDSPSEYLHPNGSADDAKSWISPESLEALNERRHCDSPGGQPRHSRVAMAAVEIAYSLFLERSRNSFQLNLTRELTDEKVFFMTLCRMTCAKRYSAWALDSCAQLADHFWEFAFAFNCTPPSRQNADKCRFF